MHKGGQVKTCLKAGLVAGVVSAAPLAHADLNNIPGLTALQAPVAAAVQSFCPRIGPSFPNRTPDQIKLSASCTKMVTTSNAQQGSGGTALNLGISEAELRDALAAIASEEVNAATQRSTIAGDRSPVSGRLLALRGASRNLSVAEVTRDEDGRIVLVERKIGRGGGAAADFASRLGTFVNLNYNTGDFGGTELQPEFDFDSFGVTAGIDYRFTDNFTSGVALTYDKNEADYSLGLGDVQSESFAVTLYSSYTQGPWFVDGHLSFSGVDYDTRRNIVVPSNTAVPGINTSATGNTDGDQWSISVGGGYDFRVNNVAVTPYGRLGYLRLEIDGFSETEENAGLALDVNSQKVTSLQSALGVRVSTPVSTAYGVLTPYAMLEWNYEFKNDSRSLIAVYTNDPFRTFFAIPTDSPDRNFFTLSAGVSAQFARGVSGFLNIDSVQGLRRVDNTGVTLGMRMEFQ